jgi:hypothetical protein
VNSMASEGGSTESAYTTSEGRDTGVRGGSSQDRVSSSSSRQRPDRVVDLDSRHNLLEHLSILLYVIHRQIEGGLFRLRCHFGFIWQL